MYRKREREIGTQFEKLSIAYGQSITALGQSQAKSAPIVVLSDSHGRANQSLDRRVVILSSEDDLL